MKGAFTRYQVIVTLAIFLPLLVCQTLVPIVSIGTWERFSEIFYPLLNRAAKMHPQPSDIVILEIDLETEKTYGWPIDRSLYSKALKNLRESGHPWILSYLQLQARETTPRETAKNMELAKTMKEYGKYVGSGLTTLTRDREEITIEQEEELIPRTLVTASGKLPEDLPYLSLAFDESEMFLRAQKMFGMAPRFGTESVIYCTRLYFSTIGSADRVTLPTSTLWAASFFKNRNFETPLGDRSEIRNAHGKLEVSAKHCLSNPRIQTMEFLKKRRVRTIPFYKAIDGNIEDLSNKLVILAHARMRAFQGPGGVASIPGSGIVPEHYLNARFVDDLITGTSVSREAIDGNRRLTILQASLTLVLFTISLFASLNWVIAFFLMTLASIGLWSLYALNVTGSYFIPAPLFMGLFSSLSGLVIFRVYLIYYGMRRVVTFREKMRRCLVEFQDFHGFNRGLDRFLKSEFSQVQVLVNSPYLELYEIVQSAEKVANYIAHKEKDLTVNSHKDENFPVFEVVARASKNILTSDAGIVCRLKVADESTVFGYVKLDLTLPKWQYSMIKPLLRQFHTEISAQWKRIHDGVEDKIADYEMLVNNTRSQIMEKFLSQSVVDKFLDGRTMEENLGVVLTPRKSYAAVLQADIRGYSGLFKDQDPLVIVEMIKSYYEGTVDVAQKVAQIKLIGDCIFLFIEERNREDVSSADLALFLAAILIRETEKENKVQVANGNAPVVFGIAIHFGDVIMGNLSSANCIDYTVVGPNVNRTARMEELTKKPEIKSLVGPNGVLISKEAEASFKYVSNVVKAHHLDLSEAGLSVRSFEHITELSYLTSDEAMALADHDLIGS